MSIRLTTAAIARATELQKKDQGLFYIGVKDAGCNGKKYVVDIISTFNPEIHEKIQLQDLTICIDKGSLKFLTGMELDCVSKSLGQWQWQFNNPNAKGSCGCGESFNV